MIIRKFKIKVQLTLLAAKSRVSHIPRRAGTLRSVIVNCALSRQSTRVRLRARVAALIVDTSACGGTFRVRSAFNKDTSDVGVAA